MVKRAPDSMLYSGLEWPVVNWDEDSGYSFRDDGAKRLLSQTGLYNVECWFCI